MKRWETDEEAVKVAARALVASYPSRFKNESRTNQTARQVVEALENIGWGL